MWLKCLTVIWVWGHLMVNILSQIDPNERAHHRDIAAPKGKVPPCVPQRGQTFCENVAGYPYDLILNALGRSKIDITKFLVDESTDDAPNFSSMIAPATSRSEDWRISENQLFDGDHVTSFHILSLPLEILHDRFTRPFATGLSTSTVNMSVSIFSRQQTSSQINRCRRLDQSSPICEASFCKFNSG